MSLTVNLVERVLTASYNSGWYNSLVEPLIDTYIKTNNFIDYQGKTRYYQYVKDLTDWHNEDGKRVKRYLIKVDLDHEYAQDSVGKMIIYGLIAIGIASIGLTLLISELKGEQPLSQLPSISAGLGFVAIGLLAILGIYALSKLKK